MKLVSRINKVTREMCTIDRYSQTRLINPESVLEHTGFVCFCALMIGKELEKAGEQIDFSELLTKATLHDIEETVTGDISCPTKYANSAIQREVKLVEISAAVQVFSDLGDTEGELYTMWSNSKHGKEGFIVALADKLAVVYKVQQEVEYFGNKTLQEHVIGLSPALDTLYQSQPDWDFPANRNIIRKIVTEAEEICRKNKS